MKFVLALGLLCLLVAATSAGKQKKKEYRYETNEDVDYGMEQEHNVKKYAKGHKHHHKHHIPLDKHSKYSEKHHEKQQQQKVKPMTKSAPHEIPLNEVELEADVKTNKKHVKEQQMKNERDELLQDVAYEAKTQEEVPEVKSPHQYQRGHHKAKHYFTHDKTSKDNVQVEEKLFSDQNSQDQAVKTILEDSFETLNEAKHSKKANKHKKAYEKGKKEKKDKKNKKEKKEKW